MEEEKRNESGLAIPDSSIVLITDANSALNNRNGVITKMISMRIEIEGFTRFKSE